MKCSIVLGEKETLRDVVSALAWHRKSFFQRFNHFQHLLNFKGTNSQYVLTFDRPVLVRKMDSRSSSHELKSLNGFLPFLT